MKSTSQVFSATVKIFLPVLIPIFTLNAEANLACRALFPTKQQPKVSIQIRDVENPADANLLRQASKNLLSLVSGHMPLPETVFMINSEYSPQYNQGMIKIRFPFFEFGENQTILKKSAHESLAIHLHELSHQVFESAITTWYANKPEILWALFGRGDGIAGLDSYGFIESSKAQTKYKNLPTEQIHEKFLNYVDLATRYNELFADTLAVFTMKDPDAIYKNIYFEENAQSKVPFIQKANAANELRRFDRSHSIEAAEAAMLQSPHGALAPARTFIWQKIYVDYHLNRHPEVPLGDVVARLAKTFIRSMAEVTNNFEIPPEQLSAAQLNQHLIYRLSEEFK